MKNLTEWFDRVYLINCQHRPERLESAKSRLVSSGMADLDKVIVHPGTVGAYTGKPFNWTAGAGGWGNLQSHRRVFERALHDRNERDDVAWDRVLVLEDDVFFVDGALEQLNMFMSVIPSIWGQLYLGGQHRLAPEPTALPGVEIGISVNRVHAYAFSRQYAKQIYQHISNIESFHSNMLVDHRLEEAHRRRDWPVYCPEKWICGQVAGVSDVSGVPTRDNLWQG